MKINGIYKFTRSFFSPFFSIHAAKAQHKNDGTKHKTMCMIIKKEARPIYIHHLFICLLAYGTKGERTINANPPAYIMMNYLLQIDHEVFRPKMFGIWLLAFSSWWAMKCEKREHTRTQALSFYYQIVGFEGMRKL
jgi:hypothetical protein